MKNVGTWEVNDLYSLRPDRHRPLDEVLTDLEKTPDGYVQLNTPTGNRAMLIPGKLFDSVVATLDLCSDLDSAVEVLRRHRLSDDEFKRIE